MNFTLTTARIKELGISRQLYNEWNGLMHSIIGHGKMITKGQMTVEGNNIRYRDYTIAGTFILGKRISVLVLKEGEPLVTIDHMVGATDATVKAVFKNVVI
jgi:hypothetical protein